jgi:hypothetical protein
VEEKKIIALLKIELDSSNMILNTLKADEYHKGFKIPL